MTFLDSNPSLAHPRLELRIRDLGYLAYEPALQIQREVQQRVIAARESAGSFMEILLVEHHPPVITVSRRPGARTHLVATDAQLKAAGVTVAETDRGGDITYHGPGQLVVYPILDLNALNLRMISYLRFLEQIVIDTLAQFGVAGVRDESATGVWIAPQDVPRQSSKICAMGVRVSRWVTMHGLALNVTTNLDHFNFIVPCGLAGRSVTSMKQLLGERCPDMQTVRAVIISQFRQAIDRQIASATPCPRD